MLQPIAMCTAAVHQPVQQAGRPAVARRQLLVALPLAIRNWVDVVDTSRIPRRRCVPLMIFWRTAAGDTGTKSVSFDPALLGMKTLDANPCVSTLSPRPSDRE